MKVDEFHKDLAKLGVTERMLRDAYDHHRTRSNEETIELGISYEENIGMGYKSACCILGLFQWGNSRQGVDFWHAVYKQLLSMED